MPTTVIRAIRSDAAWSANQSAMEALYGVGGYYTTLTLWQAARQAAGSDLVSTDRIEIAECYNDWSGNGLLDTFHITGWTTGTADVDNPRIIVRTAAGHRHVGKTGTGFRMYQSASYGKTFRVSNNNVHVRGLEAGATAASGSGFYSDQGSWSVVFDGCISTAAGGVGEAGFFLSREIARNCLAVAPTGSLAFGNSSTSSWFGYEAFNCMAVDYTTGFGGGNATDRQQGVLLRNCVAFNCDTSYSTHNDIWRAECSHNAAENGLTVTPPGSSPYGYNVTSKDFADALAGRYRLAPTSRLIGAGANLSSDFTEDMDGETRRASGAWDIGFDEFTAAPEVVHSIRASGGDYTTLSAWQTAQKRNLIDANQIAVAEVYDDWGGNGLYESVTITGWTTNAVNYVVIRGAPGHEPKGIPGGGARLYYDQNGQPLHNSQRFTRIQDLELRNSVDGNGGKYALFLLDTAYVSRCIFSAPYRCVNASGTSGAGDETLFDSCLFLPAGPVKTPLALYQSNGSWDLRVINCVAGAGCGIGFEGRYAAGVREIRLVNCVSMANTPFTGTFSPSGLSHNAAASGTPPGTDAYGSAVTSADFVNSAAKDYHLAASSGLIGAGSNQYYYAKEDVDGDAWPDTGAWDIGFDRYVSGGGPAAVTTTGIGSAEAFGTPSLALSGPTPLTLASIASAEAFGTPALTLTNLQAITLDAIASSEVFGTPSVAVGSTTALTLAGLASAEAFGTPALNVSSVQALSLSGIASAEAFGTPALSTGSQKTVSLSGIVGAEAFGTAALGVTNLQTLTLSGAASAEAFGTPALATANVQALTLTAINGAEAFGTAALSTSSTTNVTLAAIASAEAFGTALLTPHGAIGVGPAGIASAEVFGAPALDVIVVLGVTAAGVGSAEAFGNPAVAAGSIKTVATAGIAGAEAFGSAALTRLSVNSIVLSGTSSAEAFGTPGLGVTSLGAVALTAIDGAEAFGTLVAERIGPHYIGLSGIASAEVFGEINRTNRLIPDGHREWVITHETRVHVVPHETRQLLMR